MSDRNQSQVQAVESPPAPQPWAVDAYADKLMDEVFEDIDRGLDVAALPIDTTANPTEPISLQPVQIPPIVMQPIVSTPDAAATVDTEKPKRDRALMWFDRFLIALFAASALAALLLWQIQQGNIPLGAQSADADAATDAATDAAADAAADAVTETAAGETDAEAVALDPELARDREFSEYITRSLDRIEGRIPSDEDNSVIGDTLPQVAGATATLSIPVDPASSETMLRSLNRIAGALERVSSRPLPLPGEPSSNSSNNSANRSNDSSSERANPTPSSSASLPSIRVPAPVVVAPPPAPPVRASGSSSSGSAPAPAEPAAPVSTYSLVGTLDRGGGGRPAALFEVNGSASWVNVGETVGDSDWVVVDVVDDKATIERNGETRSLSVGQEF